MAQSRLQGVGMKLRMEISEELPDEVVIRCRAITEQVKQLQNAFSRVTEGAAELSLTIGENEYFISENEILFFETEADKVAAHTASNMYYSDKKLYELEKLLPHCFMRISKSCILHTGRVSSISKSITGSGEVLFKGSYKKAYVSRMYYKALKDYIYETRLSK